MAGPTPASWAVDPSDASATLVAEGVWRLRLPLAWDGLSHVNAYAVAGDDSLVLFDCGAAGHPTCAQALEHALATAGLAPEDVTTLVATHAHSDHVGLAPWLVARSGCEVWLHPANQHCFDAIRDPDRIRSARRRRSQAEGVPGDRLVAYASVDEELEGLIGVVQADHALIDGAIVGSAIGDWEAIETPGHCPSHVALIQRESGLAMLGDTACVAFVPWLDYGYSADPVSEHIASLGRLAALGPGMTGLAGHGRPLEDLPATAAMYVAGLADRTEATRIAVGAGAAGGWELSRRVFGETGDLAEEFAHFVETACYLRHLRVLGVVTRELTGAGTFVHRLAESTNHPVGSAQG
jgi:glyoxylase-like metal-dependent hydrolase (beta-lactamase superfamily II)